MGLGSGLGIRVGVRVRARVGLELVSHQAAE